MISSSPELYDHHFSVNKLFFLKCVLSFSLSQPQNIKGLISGMKSLFRKRLQEFVDGWELAENALENEIIAILP